jgi:uncharacterized protein (TIGR03067 family)
MAALLGLVMPAAGPKKASVPPDQGSLQGLWKLTAVESNGIMQSGEGIQIYKFAFVGNQYLSALPTGPNSGNYRLDNVRDPKTLDLAIRDGPGQGVTQQAIFELKGDLLWVCIGKSPSERPRDFTGRQGNGQTVFTLERLKP